MPEFDFSTLKKEDRKHLEDDREKTPKSKPKKPSKKSKKTLRTHLGKYYWQIFREMHLRLHNQLDSKAKPGSASALFLERIDDLKDQLETKKL
ncbi:MAG: hypothetical protein GF311_26570 [Candidatus Lokiarchaeota archaeon]|nr:hypothetical protein [Candidatus Lokiarchaeota archaeon]